MVCLVVFGVLGCLTVCVCFVCIVCCGICCVCVVLLVCGLLVGVWFVSVCFRLCFARGSGYVLLFCVLVGIVCSFAILLIVLCLWFVWCASLLALGNCWFWYLFC